MPINTDRILTTHVGSLPRTDRLREANARRQAGDLSEADFQQILTEEVRAIVARQVELGIDIVNDGEYGHAMTNTVDYGAWWTYSFARTGGLELTEDNPAFEVVRSTPGDLRYTSFADRRD